MCVSVRANIYACFVHYTISVYELLFTAKLTVARSRNKNPLNSFFFNWESFSLTLKTTNIFLFLHGMHSATQLWKDKSIFLRRSKKSEEKMVEKKWGLRENQILGISTKSNAFWLFFNKYFSRCSYQRIV